MFTFANQTNSMFRIQVSKLQIARWMMVAAILLILGFQVYWLHKLYMEETAGFKKTTDIVFRETMYKVQAQRLKKDSLFFKYLPEENNFMGDVAEMVTDKIPQIKIVTDNADNEAGVTISSNTQTDHNDVDINIDGNGKKKMTINYQKSFDSTAANQGSSKTINITQFIKDGIDLGMMQARRELRDKRIVFHRNQIPEPLPPPETEMNMRRRFEAKELLIKSRTLNDTISIPQIDSAYQKALVLNGIQAGFQIKRDSLFHPETIAGKDFQTSKVPVGFLNKNAYQANFDEPTGFLLQKIAPQILLSVLLVAFIAITFLFMYRNMVSQRRLALMKNDFISNITHELKTPIATVNVAVEALRNFNALESPERTKEYLDISATELQRLSLLVDKVLKLSMFENKEIELQKESFDLKILIQEVMNSMRLQFEKQNAVLNFKTAGPSFLINADRLHITSVLYNLFDNALKYSKGDPEIKVELAATQNEMTLRVSDNGIGIAADYADKIFDKFFRVPSGDHHNIKGYGLGLSYAAEVVRKHQGSISLESELGKGSTFIVKLPIT